MQSLIFHQFLSLLNNINKLDYNQNTLCRANQVFVKRDNYILDKNIGIINNID
jgi:hypothetical protein